MPAGSDPARTCTLPRFAASIIICAVAVASCAISPNIVTVDTDQARCNPLAANSFVASYYDGLSYEYRLVLRVSAGPTSIGWSYE